MCKFNPKGAYRSFPSAIRIEETVKNLKSKFKCWYEVQTNKPYIQNHGLNLLFLHELIHCSCLWISLQPDSKCKRHHRVWCAALPLFDTEEMKDGLWQFTSAHELQDSMNRKLFFFIYYYFFIFTCLKGKHNINLLWKSHLVLQHMLLLKQFPVNNPRRCSTQGAKAVMESGNYKVKLGVEV